MKVQPALRWMVVDDDHELLQLLTTTLSAVSVAEVVAFSSPLEAIQAMREQPVGFDLVITDFNMPEMDGAEMCHVLRALSPGLRTILITGNSSVSEADAERNGFDALLHKPFALSALLKTIETVQEHRTVVHSLDCTLEAA